MEKGVFSAFGRSVLTRWDAAYRFLSRVCYEDVMSVPLNSHVQIQNIRQRQFFAVVRPRLVPRLSRTK